MPSARHSCSSTAWSTWWCSGASSVQRSRASSACLRPRARASRLRPDMPRNGRVHLKPQDTVGLGAWERVQLARHPRRPFTLDYLQSSFSEFVELHGDRLFGDDAAIVGGLAALDRRTV